MPGIQTTDCPFFRGTIVASHEKVVGLLQSRHKRSKAYVLGNNDQWINPSEQPILGSLLDSGSPAHLGLKEVFMDAFPILAKPLRGPDAIVIEDIRS